MADIKRSSTTIQSVARASRILLDIAAAPSGLAAQEIADRAGLTLSTAYHLASTLVEEGLLAKVEGRRYVLGPAAGEIATAVARGLRPPARYLAALDRLATATKETAFLTGWHLGRIRILAHVEGAQAVRVSGLEVGFTGSVHARASGKLLLAFANAKLRDDILDGYELEACTPHTITTTAELQTELARVRASGIAFDREEFRDGVISAAAPIWRDGAVVAALAISAPAHRFHAMENTILSTLRSEAGSVSGILIDRY